MATCSLENELAMTSGNKSCAINSMGREGRNSFVIKFTATQRSYLRGQDSQSRRAHKLQGRFRVSNNIRTRNGENSPAPPYFGSLTRRQQAPQPDMDYLRAIYTQRNSSTTPEVDIKALRDSYAANVHYLPQNLRETAPIQMFKLRHHAFSTEQRSEQPSVSRAFEPDLFSRLAYRTLVDLAFTQAKRIKICRARSELVRSPPPDLIPGRAASAAGKALNPMISTDSTTARVNRVRNPVIAIKKEETSESLYELRQKLKDHLRLESQSSISSFGSSMQLPIDLDTAIQSIETQMPDSAVESAYDLYRELSVLSKGQPTILEKFRSFGDAIKTHNVDQRRVIIIRRNKAIQTLEKSISEQEKSHSEQLKKAEHKI